MLSSTWSYLSLYEKSRHNTKLRLPSLKWSKIRVATRQTLPAETDLKNDCDLTTVHHRAYGRALAHMKGLHNHNKNYLDYWFTNPYQQQGFNFCSPSFRCLERRQLKVFVLWMLWSFTWDKLLSCVRWRKVVRPQSVFKSVSVCRNLIGVNPSFGSLERRQPRLFVLWLSRPFIWAEMQSCARWRNVVRIFDHIYCLSTLIYLGAGNQVCFIVFDHSLLLSIISVHIPYEISKAKISTGNESVVR